MIIQLRGIRKVFETERVQTHALASIDLDVEEGEFVAISGPSGSGKTTLLSILGLLDRPTTGDYVLAGRSVTKLSRTARATIRNREIGFIFQSFNLIGEMTVRENVELPLFYRGGTAVERRGLAEDALDRVGMRYRIDHYPAQLSGGQQQRVAIARALVGAPSILLADEPTGNLDSENAAAVMNLLGELHAGGGTICMVTHDAAMAAYADRVVRMFDGRVASDHAYATEAVCAAR